MLERFRGAARPAGQAVKHVTQALEHAQRLRTQQSIAYATFFRPGSIRAGRDGRSRDLGGDAIARKCRGAGAPPDRAVGPHRARGPRCARWAGSRKAWPRCRRSPGRAGLHALGAGAPVLAGLLCLRPLAPGRVRGGASASTKELALMEKNEERICEAELHRVRGGLLARAGGRRGHRGAPGRGRGAAQGTPRVAGPHGRAGARAGDRLGDGRVLVELRAATTVPLSASGRESRGHRATRWKPRWAASPREPERRGWENANPAGRHGMKGSR